MKLRGGLWVADSSDAEVLAAHAHRLDRVALATCEHLNHTIASEIIAQKMLESIAGSSPTDTS